MSEAKHEWTIDGRIIRMAAMAALALGGGIITAYFASIIVSMFKTAGWAGVLLAFSGLVFVIGFFGTNSAIVTMLMDGKNIALDALRNPDSPHRRRFEAYLDTFSAWLKNGKEAEVREAARTGTAPVVATP